MKKLMITKNSVMKIQNVVVNHESQPVTSNPGVSRRLKKLEMVVFNWFFEIRAGKDGN